MIQCCFTILFFNLNLIGCLILAPPVLSTSPPRSIDVTSGNDILLDCSTVAFPPPKVTWLKDNEVFFPNNSNIIFEQNDQILRITKANISNRGHYKCNAKNPAGEVSNEFEVNISGKLFFILSFHLYRL